ncbi:hypothetical protein ACU4GI_10910 [Cupriavidus basilensis]
MPMMPPNPFVLALMKALGLPKGTKAFELRCAVDEVVTVKCEYYPDGNSASGFDPRQLLSKYKLVEMDEAEQASLKAADKPVVPQPTPFRRGEKGDLLTAAAIGLGPALLLLLVWLVDWPGK